MINGVPYPYDVKDEETFSAWLASIDRPVAESNGPVVSGTNSPHIEKAYGVYFKKDDDASNAIAKQLVCQRMATDLFAHLIHAPHGKIIWRCRPEFDVHHDAVPADLSQRMNRKQIDAELGTSELSRPRALDAVKSELGKADWGVDFTTDSIFPVAAPLGEWRIFKSYMRYSVVIGKEVIYPKMRAA